MTTTKALASTVEANRYQREWFAGLYVTDSWKMTPKVTINAGLRWEPYLPTVDTKKKNGKRRPRLMRTN